MDEQGAFLSAVDQRGNLAGNAIDFCVQVLGLSFHDAMRALLRT